VFNLKAENTLVLINGESLLYGVELGSLGKKLNTHSEDIYNFSVGTEIALTKVQEMAVKYAEVSPEKIDAWRRSVKWKAIMPKLSVGLSQSFDDNVEIYKSASTSYIVEGPHETDTDWNVGLTWDLSDIVWDNAQTSIDVRSRLMVQLRNDILEDVTRLYFERKRLILELMKRERKDIIKAELDQKRLRIEELTGYIDALTGGQFSKEIGLGN